MSEPGGVADPRAESGRRGTAGADAAMRRHTRISAYALCLDEAGRMLLLFQRSPG